jgi:phospholipase/lecithinase/hemolysin
MKKWWLATVGFTLCIILILGSFHPASAQNYPQIYVFGDSLSDIGNIYQATNNQSPPSPPYFQGRYSNGPVWVEYFKSRLNLTANLDNNFAYGGAETGNSQQLPPGVLTQIERFKSQNPTVDSNALYIIWAGANDYLGGTNDTTLPINNLTTAVKRLAEIGAQNISVINLPDLGKLPATRTTQSANLLNNLTQRHNSGLAASLESLRQQFNSEINIRYIDVNVLFNQVYSSPKQYGFTNVTQACFQEGVICNRPDEYLFWDGIHPSTAAHKLFVELASTKLTPAAKPVINSRSTLGMPLIILILVILVIGLIIWQQRKRIKNSA